MRFYYFVILLFVFTGELFAQEKEVIMEKREIILLFGKRIHCLYRRTKKNGIKSLPLLSVGLM